MPVGAPVPSSAPEGELRLATVVACDLVDSTALLGALDPSDRLKVMRALRRLVEEVAARHGGWLERWDGGGATPVFGYPELHEDTPEVAARAGMELITGVQRLGVPAGPLIFRVGVSSGELAVGLATGELVGHAFNMADRLRAAGEPGWIVVGDATPRLAGAFFIYDDLGAVAAKGFSDGLQAWRVLAETTARGAYVEGEGHCRAGLAIIDHTEDVTLRNELNFRLLAQLGVPLAGQTAIRPRRWRRRTTPRAACNDTADATKAFARRGEGDGA